MYKKKKYFSNLEKEIKERHLSKFYTIMNIPHDKIKSNDVFTNAMFQSLQTKQLIYTRYPK